MKFLLTGTRKILERIGGSINPKRTIVLYQKLLFKKELSVSTFCNIKIDVPFRVNIEPLDVHEYRNCDKLFVKLNNFDGCENQEPLVCEQVGNNIYIKDAISKAACSKDLSCTVIAPIKANLNVNSKYGDIAIKNFNSEKVLASSETGNIAVNGYQGKEVIIQTSRGNVELGGVIQSSSIIVSISEHGSIKVNKLLGENTNIATKLGNILVNSSYCNKSKFAVEQGDMNLKNIHKHCEVINKMSGNINIASLDGHFKITQENGKADIHLSRVTEDSEINIMNGHLLLRLSEECQETTNFSIKSKRVNLKKNVIVKEVHPGAEKNNLNTVDLNCKNCSVDIEAASWFDMNIPNKSDFA